MRSVGHCWLLSFALVGRAGSRRDRPSRRILAGPAEVTFALLLTEFGSRRSRGAGAPFSPQPQKDLGIRVKSTVVRDRRHHRGTIEALKFKKAKVGWLGPKGVHRGLDQQLCERRARGAGPQPERRPRVPLVPDHPLGVRHLHPRGSSPGKTFAFNDPNSTSGYLVPMGMLPERARGRREEALLEGPTPRARTRPRYSPWPTRRSTSRRPTCPT